MQIALLSQTGFLRGVHFIVKFCKIHIFSRICTFQVGPLCPLKREVRRRALLPVALPSRLISTCSSVLNFVFIFSKQQEVHGG